MAWEATLYAAAALLGLVQFAMRVPEAESYLSSREAHGVHVVMNLGMAAMASSLWTPAGRIAIAAVLGALAALLAARLALQRKPGRRAGTGYHLLAVGAMLYGIQLMPAGMHMGMDMKMAPGWPALMLAVLFAIDAVATAILGLGFPATLLRMEEAASGVERAPSHRAIAVLRLSTMPHIVMDVGMVAMLVAH